MIVDDQDEEMQKFLELIKIASQVGHSLEVIADPDNKEYRRSFFFDGDGAFKIRDLRVKKIIEK